MSDPVVMIAQAAAYLLAGLYGIFILLLGIAVVRAVFTQGAPTQEVDR